MEQLYLPIAIEANDFRAILHSEIYDVDILAIHGETTEEALKSAKKQLPKLKKIHRDNFTISRVEQLVLDQGKEVYKTIKI